MGVKLNDRVRTKEGISRRCPIMKVVDFRDHGRVALCAWFWSGNGISFCAEEFPVETLVHVWREGEPMPDIEHIEGDYW